MMNKIPLEAFKASAISPLNVPPLFHGGDLYSAAQEFNIAVEDWIDLSTGINPCAYPIPEMPLSVFTHLPYLQPDFIRAVQHYYQQSEFVAAAGTQAIIQCLPELLNKTLDYPVLLPELGYQEHAYYWRKFASEVFFYHSVNEAEQAEVISKKLKDNPKQHLVLISPNNPTAAKIKLQNILAWADAQAQDAYLIVDEAFIDIAPEESVLGANRALKNIIVLRSFGKFFGLAGIRLGFVFADVELLAKIHHKMGSWQVNGPAQYIASQALMNASWQIQARQEISKNCAFTETLFASLFHQIGVERVMRSSLFTSYQVQRELGLEIYSSLARLGVLIRVIEFTKGRVLLRLGCIDREKKQEVSHLKECVASIKVSMAQAR